MKNISKKTKWIRTDAWRGYYEPIDAVCGANDTGSWDDSPCPTKVCKAELSKAVKILREHEIPYRTQVTESSNIFCVHRYLVVHPENVERAKELIKPIINDCILLYLA